MPSAFSPIKGAQGFQQSNPGVLSTVSLLGSLEVFQAAGGLDVLRKRSVALTKVLEEGIRSSKYYVPIERVHEATQPCMTIITPADSESRGAQLSLLFAPTSSGTMQKVQEYLKAYGVVGDERNPDVIRLAAAPLYVSEEDCKKAIQVLNDAFESLANE